MIKSVLKQVHDESMCDGNHRFKSWQHCYNFFNKYKGEFDEESIDYACLNLGFYLASWGMMRGSTFLLQKDYKVHKFFIKEVAMNDKYKKYYHMNNSKIKELWEVEDLIEKTKKSYENNINIVNGEKKSVKVTDTLASKILLGVFGIMPAYDRYLITAMKAHGLNKTILGEKSLKNFAKFYDDYENEFVECKALFEKDKVIYTPMKLVDMYFWQVGYMLDNEGEFSHEEIDNVKYFACNYKNSLVDKKVDKAKNSSESTQLKNTILKYIYDELEDGKSKGLEFVDLKCGNIQKSLGINNRAPSVCNAMMVVSGYQFEVLDEPPKKNGTRKTVRYYCK